MQAHPEWSVYTLFEKLEYVFPGRYTLARYPDLQRTVRKIRTHLRKQVEDPWPLDIILGLLPDVLAPEPGEHQVFQNTDERTDASSSSILSSPSPQPITTRRTETDVPERATSAGEILSRSSADVSSQATRMASDPETCMLLPIEQEIQTLLEERGIAERESQTLIWHQVALRSLQEYLARHGINFLEAITTGRGAGLVGRAALKTVGDRNSAYYQHD